MDNERRRWQEELIEKFRKLIEPAKSMHELGIRYPVTDKHLIKKGVIEVLKGDVGEKPLSDNEINDLKQLHRFLQWVSPSLQYKENEHKTLTQHPLLR